MGAGGVVQAASIHASTLPNETVTLRRVDVMGIDMWLLIAEAGFALFLLVFIVWWTMYSGKKPEDGRPPAHPAPREEHPDRPDGQ